LAETETRWKPLAEAILTLQPFFAIPVYFSVLNNTPSIWLGLVIAAIPLGIRFLLTRRLIERTIFDLPIALFLLGSVVGLIVAADKQIAFGALSSTFGSAVIYYGLTGNSKASNRYWLIAFGVMCLLVLAATFWFFSQGFGRQLSFNKWAFDLFNWLPKTDIKLQEHGIGSVLSVIVPPLLAVAVFNKQLWLRVSSAIFGGFFLFCLLLSDSGTGWIAVICGLVFVALVWRLWTISLIIPATLIGLAGFVALYSKSTLLSQSFSTASLLSRVDLWVKTIPLLSGWHAVTGLGLGSWYNTFGTHYGEFAQHLHNNYLQIFADTGIIGLVAMIVAYVIFVKLCIRIIPAVKNSIWHQVTFGLAAGILAGGFFALFDVTTMGIVISPNAFIYISVPVLWIWAAFLVISERKARMETLCQ
jgi:O-antigen ligase